MSRVFSLVITFLSLALFVLAGVLWVRSLHHIDLYANLEPAANDTSVLRGVGAYHGALMIGSLEDPQSCKCESGYQHSVFPLVHQGEKGSMLQVVPREKHSALGFGASKGELQYRVPILSLFGPPVGQKYEVVYVPFYALMLLGMVQPARVMMRRRWGTGIPAAAAVAI